MCTPRSVHQARCVESGASGIIRALVALGAYMLLLHIFCVWPQKCPNACRDLLKVANLRKMSRRKKNHTLAGSRTVGLPTTVAAIT